MDILTEKIKNKIIEISNNNKNEEICGLVIKRFDNLLVFECENVAFHKKNHCVLNPLDYIKADKMGEIIAHFHSQDEDGYSNTDFINACGHNIFSIIYCKKNENFYIIDPKNKNYLNLDFKIGENDCFSLVRNFYKDRFNIIINNYERNENWYKKDPNIILNNFTKENFKEIDTKDIKENDVLIFNIGGVSQHFAIYMGNNFILHHPFNSVSIINELTNSLKNRIIKVVRHNNFFYE